MTLISDATSSGGFSNSTSASCTFTTAHGNDIIIALCTVISSTPQTVASFGGTASLQGTWRKRASFTSTSIISGVTCDFEIWWNYATSAITSQTVTFNCSAAVNGTNSACGLSIIAINGAASLTSPFDPSSGVPATDAVVASGVGTTFSTSNPNDYIINAAFAQSSPTPANTNMTQINNVGLWGVVFGQLVSSAQTNSTLAELTTARATWMQYIDAIAGPPSLTMPLDTGSYAITGSAAALLHDHYLLSSAGAYNITGSAAALLHDHLLSSAGAYNITGSAAAFLYGYVFGGAAGAYAINGDAADLFASQDYTLDFAVGSYTITGRAPGAILTMGIGSYAYMFGGDTPGALLTMPLDTGSYAITGIDALLEQVLDGQPGVYTITGFASSGLADIFLPFGWGLPAGTYSIDGRGPDLFIFVPEIGPTEREGGGGIAPKEIARDKEIYNLFETRAVNREIEAGVPSAPVAWGQLTTPFSPANQRVVTIPAPRGKPK
jgi:hypothetical protein